MARTRRKQTGFTLIEVLVSMAVFSIFMSGASAFFSDNFRRSKDGETITKTNSKAQRIANLLLYELRMIGSGVPFSQANFPIGGAGLGDAPQPFLTSSTDSALTVRLSEYGVVSVLEADFDPSSANTFSLSNVDDLSIGDTIYLSNSTTGGDDALQGEVLSVVGNNVTIDGGYVAPVGATFPPGSISYRVSQVTYSSPGGGAGILRSDGINTITLDPNSTLTFTYLDATGTAIGTPLSTADIANSLSAIQFTLTTTATEPLKNGTFYSKTMTKIVNLRNLNLIRA